MDFIAKIQKQKIAEVKFPGIFSRKLNIFLYNFLHSKENNKLFKLSEIE